MISTPTDPRDYRPQELWTPKSALMPLVLVLLACIIPVAVSRVVNVGDMASDAWHCFTTECDPEGAAVSWKEQLSAADAEAHKGGREAILTGVAAEPAAFREADWNPDKALDVTFTYVLTDGRGLDVRVWDTSPASSIRTSVDNKGGLPISRDYADMAVKKEELAAIVAGMAISPRQAARKVWEFRQENWGLEASYGSPRIGLTFSAGRWQGEVEYNIDREWNVYVRSVEVDYSGYRYFTVDAVTGTIKAGRDIYSPVPPTPSPTP
ncbi:MAG: hypothetical protein WCD37_03545 [Chloroflexia bacterium]